MKNKIVGVLRVCGFSWFVPFVNLFAGEDPRQQFREIWNTIGITVIAFAGFLMLWSMTASKVNTSLGTLPGPAQALVQAKTLVAEHQQERLKEAGFYQKQATRNAEALKTDPQAQVKVRKYAGKPTYLDQILRSLSTVFTGFVLASIIAVPIGIVCGLSPFMMTAFNPFIQIFKPVSPLAWLPLVTMVVSAVYTNPQPWLEKSFINSAVTVALCSLWPSIINTAVGVSSLDKDYLNVAKVLKLGFFTKIFKIVLPASLPYIFTGLRISLGVGWMVLIAAEMLAQNPGLGKFVWDEFQNGSSGSLARIMVAVLTIGIIGFILDRLMVISQRLISFKQS